MLLLLRSLSYLSLSLIPAAGRAWLLYVVASFLLYMSLFARTHAHTVSLSLCLPLSLSQAEPTVPAESEWIECAGCKNPIKSTWPRCPTCRTGVDAREGGGESE